MAVAGLPEDSIRLVSRPPPKKFDMGLRNTRKMKKNATAKGRAKTIQKIIFEVPDFSFGKIEMFEKLPMKIRTIKSSIGMIESRIQVIVRFGFLYKVIRSSC
jgi:hypothetical protein